MTSGPSWRAAALCRLSQDVFDVLVVGGGATGAAVARDAALRGLQVALCERGDFACETSSQSTKLIHGGLRYLEHGHLPLVFEALAERAVLLRTAAHLCRPVEFLFPGYRGESPSLAKLGLGVALYDALALWRPPTRSRRLEASALYRLAPRLRTAGLEGACAFVDCQTDDARLVLEHLLDAGEAGAVVLPYVEVERPQPRRGHLHRLTVLDRPSGARLSVQARAVVSATGPFSDTFRGQDRALRPTLGVHIVLKADRLPTEGRAFVLRAPRDHRIFFVLPAGARTLVGTTDTDWCPPDSDRPPAPGDEIRARREDVDYLLEAVRHAFPSSRLGPEDVISTFAGLRPLLAGGPEHPSATSREHAIWVDRLGVLTIAGGKLTTLRRMGEETVDRLIELLRARGLDRPLASCTTRTRPLPGAPDAEQGATLLAGHELAEDVRLRLQGAYGLRAGQVLALASGDPSLARRLVPDLPYVRAEVLFAARYDRACEVEDVLRRRVPLFRDDPDQGLGVAEHVADLLAAELGWSVARRERSLAAYRAAVAVSRRWRTEPEGITGGGEALRDPGVSS
jgi:glycerol-3-phosphate dehydrogenase